MTRTVRTDVVLAVLLTALGVTEALLGLTGTREPWYVVATVPVAGAAVLLRRVRPPAAVAAMLAAFLGQAVLGSDLPGGLTAGVVLVLVVYAVGAHRSARTAVPLLVAVLAGVAGVIALGEPRAGNFVFAGVVVLGAWAAGRAVRLADERSTLLAERAAQQERSRIAGELHDVVSHHVSAMVVQAGAERRDLPADSGTAHTLADIEHQGRQTLTELRRLLGVLHRDTDAPLAPQPGLGDLADLVHGCTSSGLAVTLRSEGPPRPVDDGVGLAVYRVVQESLTNVRKHAADHEATVTLRWQPESLQVEVLNEGPGRRRRLLPGAGHGLTAMRERVAAFGGTLSTGRRSDGYRVLATLPTEAR